MSVCAREVGDGMFIVIEGLQQIVDVDFNIELTNNDTVNDNMCCNTQCCFVSTLTTNSQYVSSSLVLNGCVISALN